MGTFADENDQLSEYVPSPRRNGISDEAYLKSVAEQNNGKIGFQPKN